MLLLKINTLLQSAHLHIYLERTWNERLHTLHLLVDYIPLKNMNTQPSSENEKVLLSPHTICTMDTCIKQQPVSTGLKMLVVINVVNLQSV